MIGYAGFALFLPIWEKKHFGYADYYPPEYLRIIVPGYIAVWLFLIFLTTGYEKKVKATDLIRGVLIGSLAILVIYALLPENWRFSRALILIGTLWILISTNLIRYLLSKINKNIFSFEYWKKRKRIIIVGDKQESNRVYSIIRQTQVIPELVGFVNPVENRINGDFIGHIDQIEEIVRINQADELVFCAASMSSQSIIRTMLQFTDTGIEFKIAPPESLSVIGSNSNDATGELYVLHFNTLSRLISRRKKRLFDILFSLFLLSGYPVFIFLVKKPTGLLRNIFTVLFGISLWVGYYRSTGGEHPGLPKIRTGVLTPLDKIKTGLPGNDFIEQANLSYAKDYRILFDLKIIINSFNQLGG
jgi:hypothetical protein